MFADDPEQHSRSEDSSIAYTWLHYIEDPTNDTEYILFLPMTKAGVKAMDATTEFLTSALAPQEIQDANLNPTQFVVSGASKVSLLTIFQLQLQAVSLVACTTLSKTPCSLTS